MNLFDLVAKITLDDKGFNDGVKGAEEKGSGLGAKLATAGKVAAGAFTVVTGTVAAVGGAMINATGKTAEYADNIDKMSQKLGMSAEAYQEWDFIAQHSGTTVDGLQASMKTLSVAAENGKDTFEKLGISLDEVRNLSQEDLFSKVITQLQGMEEGTERTALASELLGRSATELAPLLNTSAEATEEMRKQVHELGGVMSDDAVKAGAAYQDSLQNLQTAIGGLKKGLTGDMMPAITKVMDGLTAIFSGDEGGVQQLSEGIDTLISNITDAIPQFFEVGGRILDALVQAIIKNLPKLMDTGIDILLKLVDGIIKALPKLIPAAVEAITALVTALIENLPLLIDGAIQLVIGLVEAIPNIVTALVDAIPTIIELLVSALIDALPLLISGAIQLVIALVQHLPEIIVALIEAIPQIIAAIIEAFVPVVEELGEVFKNAWEGIKSVFSNVKQWFGDKFSEGKEAASNAWSNVKADFSNRWEQVKSAFSDAGNWFSNKFTESKNLTVQAWSNVKTLFSGVWNNIKSAFRFNDALTWGKDLLNNFINGIKSKIQSLKNAVSNVAQTVRNFLHFTEPDEGPLADFHTYSPDMIDLFIEGMKKNERKLRNAVADTFDFKEDMNLTPSFAVSGAATTYSGGGFVDNLANSLVEAMANTRIYLDSGELVGAMTPAIDRSLGTEITHRGRAN